MNQQLIGARKKFVSLSQRPLGRKDIKKIEAHMSHERLYQTWLNDTTSIKSKHLGYLYP
jgi:hypothetical protein